MILHFNHPTNNYKGGSPPPIYGTGWDLFDVFNSNGNSETSSNPSSSGNINVINDPSSQFSEAQSGSIEGQGLLGTAASTMFDLETIPDAESLSHAFKKCLGRVDCQAISYEDTGKWPATVMLKSVSGPITNKTSSRDKKYKTHYRIDRIGFKDISNSDSSKQDGGGGSGGSNQNQNLNAFCEVNRQKEEFVLGKCLSSTTKKP